MQISRSLDEARKRGAESEGQDARDLAAWIVLDRSAQAAQRGFAAVLDQLVQTATIGEKSRLPVVGFQLRRGLDDLAAKAKDLDPKLRALFIEQLDRVRALAFGPDAILAVRAQELDLIGRRREADRRERQFVRPPHRCRRRAGMGGRDRCELVGQRRRSRFSG